MFVWSTTLVVIKMKYLEVMDQYHLRNLMFAKVGTDQTTRKLIMEYDFQFELN